jgi:hypothetical protein
MAPEEQIPIVGISRLKAGYGGAAGGRSQAMAPSGPSLLTLGVEELQLRRHINPELI